MPTSRVRFSQKKKHKRKGVFFLHQKGVFLNRKCITRVILSDFVHKRVHFGRICEENSIFFNKKLQEKGCLFFKKICKRKGMVSETVLAHPYKN